MLVFAFIGDICISPGMACVLLRLLDDQTTLMGTIYSGLQLNTHTVTGVFQGQQLQASLPKGLKSKNECMGTSSFILT